MFPTTIQYIETITNSEELFNTIEQVDPIIGDNDELIFCSGNFGTVFKINTSKGVKALKCFTRQQAGRFFAYKRISEAIEPSKYVIEYKYIDDEILVFDDTGHGQYYPVLLMEWIEGETFAKHIERAAYSKNRTRLAELADKFLKFSEWLLEQTFAHNDLKPDNIMVQRDTDELMMIDYDGMYVESMAGELSREYGTAPFQSPNRPEMSFDVGVDNYSIAYIRKALNALIQHPELYSPSSLVEFSNDELTQIEEARVILGNTYRYLGSPSENMIVYKRDELYGFIESSGKMLTNAIFERVLDFTKDGLAAVYADNLWGYIDRMGKMIIPQIFQDCVSFSDGIAAVKLFNKWGFINTKGENIIRYAYDNAWSHRQGLALVRKDGKYGFVGQNGKVAISVKYDFAHNFTSEGVACVKLGNKYGYIDRRGKWWEKPIYDYAQNFRDGIAAVELNNRKFYIKFTK